MSLKIEFFGAAQTVTGSQTLVSHRHFGTMIDCGLYQGAKDLRLLNWARPSHLNRTNAVILTHAHIDHCGLLPRWVAEGFRGPVYCSEGTASLLPIMLMDAARLQEEDARYAARTQHSRHNPPLPLYTTEDAQAALALLRPVRSGASVQLTETMSFRLQKAGHILGSSAVVLQVAEADQSQLIAFSGDLGGGSSDVLSDPEVLLECDALVLESTYGDRQLDRTQREMRLAQFINRVIGRGGRVLIPSFALGRTQDLLMSLYRLKTSGRIADVPVFLDSPMARQVTAVYRAFGESDSGELNRDFDAESVSSSWFKTVDHPDESMLLVQNTEPKIVLSASGMLQGGRILHHLKHALPRDKDGVLFVGFQGQGTKGRILIDGAMNLRIHHQEVAVEAEIGTLDGYSAHADQGELLAWCSRMRRPPRKVYINHGESQAQLVLAKKLSELWPQAEVIIPALNSSHLL